MDELQEWELYALYDNIQYSDFNLREMSRMICYVTAQVNSSSKLTPQKLWSLPWDVSTSRNSDQKSMSKEELEKTSKFEEILKKIKSGEIETTSVT